MTKKVSETMIKAANLASPIPLPTKKNRRRFKKAIRKTDRFLSKTFPEATKKLIKFNEDQRKKTDEFNEKADIYMEKNFPKITKIIKRTLKSNGGRIGLKMGSKCKLATKGKGRAYGKNS